MKKSQAEYFLRVWGLLFTEACERVRDYNYEPRMEQYWQDRKNTLLEIRELWYEALTK